MATGPQSTRFRLAVHVIVVFSLYAPQPHDASLLFDGVLAVLFPGSLAAATHTTATEPRNLCLHFPCISCPYTVTRNIIPALPCIDIV